MDFPAPFSPTTATSCPGRTASVGAVQHPVPAVGLVHVPRFQHRSPAAVTARSCPVTPPGLLSCDVTRGFSLLVVRYADAAVMGQGEVRRGDRRRR